MSNTPGESKDSKSAGTVGDKTGEADLSSRLDDLDARIQSKRKENSRSENRNGNNGRSTSAGLAQGFRLSSEFIAAICVGAGIGYLIDQFFGITPWGMIVFLFLGFGAGVLNALRAAGLVAESNMHLGAGSNQKEDE